MQYAIIIIFTCIFLLFQFFNFSSFQHPTSSKRLENALKGLKHSIKVPRFYRCSAKIMVNVKAGGNLKSLISELKHPNKRGIMSLVIKTLQHSHTIEKLFASTGILQKECKMDENLAAVLVTELVWGKKVLQSESKPVQTLLKYEDDIFTALKTTCVPECESVDSQKTIYRPRYVRVNTVKQPTSAIINYFTKRTWKLLSSPEGYREYIDYIKSNLNEGHFIRDYHLEDVLLFPEGTVFATNKLFKYGNFLLQDKSSSMAAHILAPEPGSTVLDMCAAPGMKTSHLAALMKNQGKIYATDHDRERYKTLLETIKRCGLKCVTPIWGNILHMKKLPFTKIDYISLDPSCSGTGMLSRLAYEKNPPSENRLQRLSNLQARLLRHALTSFPSVKRVVYSTCSVKTEENEAVVEEALAYASDFQLIDCSKIFKQWSNFGLPDYKCGKRCIRAVPEDDCMNGFFIAAFERILR